MRPIPTRALYRGLCGSLGLAVLLLMLAVDPFFRRFLACLFLIFAIHCLVSFAFTGELPLAFYRRLQFRRTVAGRTQIGRKKGV